MVNSLHDAFKRAMEGRKEEEEEEEEEAAAMYIVHKSMPYVITAAGSVKEHPQTR